MYFNIIHTEWSDGWGGQERRIVAELAGMQALGHRVLLATRPTARIGPIASAQGIPVTLLPFKGKADVQSIRGLSRIASQEGYGIIHTHSSVDTWVGAFAAKLSGAHFVRTRHLNIPMRRSWYTVHGHYDRLMTCGEVMRTQLIEQYGFREEEVVSIPTGVDFDRFQPARSRDEVRSGLGLAAGHFMILMAAVVRAVKRHEVALKAFSRTLAELPHARLVLAGEGPMRAAMQRLAEELGIASSVIWLGHREDVADLMSAADAVLLTSRSEGVPQALTQALSLGAPVVSTAVGGVPEVVRHEETGLLVAPEATEAIAAALVRIENDPQWARSLGNRGRQHVREHFSVGSMLDKTLDVYDRLARV